MMKSFAIGLSVALALTGAAAAETFEVQMLNQSEADRMVFEPAFLTIAPGDTVHFVSTDRGHNAESVDGMIPEGAEAFSGRINEEIEVTFDVEGLYGIRCTPHFAMGMVMTIAVGEVDEAPEGFLEGRIPRTALQRFEEQLTGL